MSTRAEFFQSMYPARGRSAATSEAAFRADNPLSEFKACINAYHNWSTEILNALNVPYSNGFTEGCNNKTKVLKRVCFGLRNFERFRSRILHCSC